MSAVPSKHIFQEADVAVFHRSLPYHQLRYYVARTAELVRGVPVPPGALDMAVVTRRNTPMDHAAPAAMLPPSDGLGSITEDVPESAVENATEDPGAGPYQEGAAALVALLKLLRQWIGEIPPETGTRRFGNPAAKTWHERVVRETPALLEALGPRLPLGDLTYYLVNAFGSSIRLDYGSGHELSFLGFLMGCVLCGVVDWGTQFHWPPPATPSPLPPPAAHARECLAIWSAYYDLVRDLIFTYTLEPAGLHGVWGLDDHFHLVYIWGASQLVLPETTTHLHRPSFRPLQFLTPGVLLLRFAAQNLFVNALLFIKKVKSGPFNEHLPLLYDLTAVVLWAKIARGLLKMYDVEVLGKFPVVQHFYFGSVLYRWVDEQGKPLPSTGPVEEPAPVHAGVKLNRAVNPSIPTTRAPWASR